MFDVLTTWLLDKKNIVSQPWVELTWQCSYLRTTREREREGNVQKRNKGSLKKIKYQFRIAVQWGGPMYMHTHTHTHTSKITSGQPRDVSTTNDGEVPNIFRSKLLKFNEM